MKKAVTIVVLLLALGIPSTTWGQIPNPGFEAWTGTTDPYPDGWVVNNIPGFVVPVTRSATAHGGSYALQASVVSYLGVTSWPPTLTSIFPYTGRPAALTGYYRLTSVNFDSLVVFVWLWKQSFGTLYAFGAFGTNVSTDQWTKFTAPLEYISDVAPDTAYIQVYLTGRDSVYVGSSYLLDDLAFEGTATGTEEQELKPTAFALDQNYPNPFNPSTTITYALPHSTGVKLSIFDMLGREVSVLVNEKMDAGTHAVRFDAGGLPSGTYFARIQAGEFTQTRRLLLLK